MSTTTITRPEKLVGKRIRRREDPRLITGTATYVDDIKLPDMHYAALVRSPHAAANIRSIDISKAAALPGVVAVYTGPDTERRRRRGVRRRSAWASQAAAQHACHRSRLSRRPSGCCRGRDGSLRRGDAADLIEVDYDVLQAVADPEKALAPGAPAVHPQWPDNIAFNFDQEGGDVDTAFAEADVICKQRIISQRLMANPMETRGWWRVGMRRIAR